MIFPLLGTFEDGSRILTQAGFMKGMGSTTAVGLRENAPPRRVCRNTAFSAFKKLQPFLRRVSSRRTAVDHFDNTVVANGVHAARLNPSRDYLKDL